MITKYTWEGNEVCGANVEIIAITDIYGVSVSVYFVSGGEITHPPTVTVGQVVNERSANLPVAGKEKPEIFDEVCLQRRLFLRTFPLDSSTI
jgi:hypothetical protein